LHGDETGVEGGTAYLYRQARSSIDSNVRQWAMRALILLSVLGIALGAHSAQAGLSSTPREMSAPSDTAGVADQANQQAEDQIGLTRAKRLEVQRGLTRLGFRTRLNGKFDQQTRDAITRWQDEHGYPKTGFLDAAQHQALLNDSTAAMEAGKANDQPRRRGGGRVHHSRGVGGPIGVIGHMVGGLFGR
jgi:putative peptidoglycan binding protein